MQTNNILIQKARLSPHKHITPFDEHVVIQLAIITTETNGIAGLCVWAAPTNQLMKL